MKFIHAADLHLDSPFRGLTSLPGPLATRVRQSTFTAATKIFDRAIAESVDFVVLAGDLFDRTEQSVAAQAYLIQQFDRLHAADIPVLISFGNHDFATDQRQVVTYPDNVTVFGPNVTTHTLALKSGATVAISGFSYPQRWVTTDPIDEFPARATTDWHLGLLHGAIAAGAAVDHYAPFTVAELQAKHYDYWALGHIHHHQALSMQPPIIYAGNPQGRSIAETGAKGAYLVTSQGRQLMPEFFATADLLWERHTLKTQATTLSAIGTELTTWLRDHPAPQPTLTSLDLQLSRPLTAEDQAQWQQIDWLSLYQRTRGSLLKTSQRYLTQLTLLPVHQPLTAPQLDATYWQQGAQSTFTPAAVRTLFGKLGEEPTLAEWFDTAVTTQSLQELATQRLQTFMDEEGPDHVS